MTLRTALFGILAVTATQFAGPVLADERYMSADIKSDIVGRRIFLAAPLGGEFPLNYRSNGQVDGNGKAVGLGRIAQPKDNGRWWIESDRLCQKFTTWYKGEPMCFELYRTGENTLKWIRNNGQTGTARIGAAL